MFERFTERARQAVVLAQDEARSLKHNYIGTEHLLLGLLREEEGLAARVLGALGVTLDQARARVVGDIGEGEEPPAGQIPFTPRTKKVLELALREALSLGHNHIGTEHILLGIAREEKSVGAQILRESGVDSGAVRTELIGVVGVAAPGALRRFPKSGRRSRLDAIERQLSEVLRRLEEIERRLPPERQ